MWVSRVRNRKEKKMKDADASFLEVFKFRVDGSFGQLNLMKNIHAHCRAVGATDL